MTEFSRLICSKCSVSGTDVELKQIDTLPPDSGFPEKTSEKKSEYEIWQCPNCRYVLLVDVSGKGR